MKVGIVGCGLVGSTAAYAMTLQRIASEIVLIDVNVKLARAQAEDIAHATPFSNPVRIYSGDFNNLDGARIVILACGATQPPAETRMQLLGRNYEVFKSVVPQVLTYAPEAILLIASNPVDVITEFVTQISELPPARVIGSGTILDTARFRTLLAEHLSVAASSVHAYVLGEHGDSEVLIWSSASVGALPIKDFAQQIGRRITEEVKNSIDQRVRYAAYRIIEGKKATYFGIGAGLARIAQAIRDDEHSVLTVSMHTPEFESFCASSFSVPRIIGAEGVLRTLWPVLSTNEHELLKMSVTALDEVAKSVLGGCPVSQFAFPPFPDAYHRGQSPPPVS
jgi:L-lactate dehydrogenase